MAAFGPKRPNHPWEYRLIPGEKLYVGIRKEEELMNWLEEEEVLCFHSREPEGEGFYLQRIPGKMTVVCGGSASGALYGCLKLAELMREEKELPAELNFYDAPAFKLRGLVWAFRKQNWSRRDIPMNTRSPRIVSPGSTIRKCGRNFWTACSGNAAMSFTSGAGIPLPLW